MTTLEPALTMRTGPRAGDACSAPAAGARARVYFADHLRAALVALVLIHHLTITFALALPGGWYFEVPNSNAPAEVFGVFLLTIDQAFWLLLNPVTLAVAAIASHQSISTGWGAYLNAIGPGPLWFVEVLFLLSLGYVAIRPFFRHRAPEPSREPAAPPTLRMALLFTLGLAAATFLFRLAVPIGYALPGLGLPTPAYLPQYVGLFAVGVIAGRRDWFRSMPDRMGWIGFAVCGVVTVAVYLPALASGLGGYRITGGLHWQAAAYALWDSTMAVGMFCGLLAVFRRWTNRKGRLWDEVSRSSFGVYVLHPPLLVLVALPIALAPIDPLLKLQCGVALPGAGRRSRRRSAPRPWRPQS